MDKKLTIGLIGCGIWGRNILRDLGALGCQVIVVEPSVEQRAQASAGGAETVVETIRELPEVEGVIVATPATTHAAVIEELLERRVPIFVEKPFTTDVRSAERLAGAAANRLFMMHLWRYHHGIELLGQIARSGELGPVHTLRSTRVNWTSPRRDTDAIWTLAPHDLSIAIEILGRIPLPRSATVERCGPANVGMIGILGNEPTFVFEVSTRYRDKRREVRLHCREGVAVLPDTDSQFIEVIRNSEPAAAAPLTVEQRPILSEPPLLRELRAFREFLRGGPPPKSDAAEGLAVVQTIETLRKLAGV